ncbi:MAG: STAS domain-containing protein [Clostridia bacterium]|nr:STAS domain-containing protein [Clostridia bacterium]
MEKLRPEFFNALRGYGARQLVKDLTAGLIVAIIALPLSIALALASNVPPERGIYTAIIAGFLISFLGGSRVQIAGPTAAFATIVAGIVTTKGMSGLVLATVLAGIFLILMGVFKLGTLIQYIPYTITVGFTAGIAVTIVVGQLKDFVGLVYPDGTVAVETMEKLEVFAEHFDTFNPWALLVGAVCLAILIVWPFVSKKIPGSLIAIIVSILMVKLLDLPVKTIGDLYEISSSLPALTLPEISFAGIRDAIPDAFTIAVLAGIESLLSCVVADGMIADEGYGRHNSNMELIAQGVGNIGSVLFGGIPATGAIARTAANIKNGGRSPIAGMVHALILLLVLVVLMPYAALIPMPAIAAILLMVAYNMSEWRHFLHLCKTAPATDIIVLVATFALTVIFDLVVAIAAGLVLSLLFFASRMHGISRVTKSLQNPDEDYDVYTAQGPIFFGASQQIAAIVPAGRDIILDMQGVPAVDATGLKSLGALRQTCSRAGVELSFINLAPQVDKALQRAHLV